MVTQKEKAFLTQGGMVNVHPWLTQAAGDTTIVVTRHPALVDYLREQGLIGPDAEVITHATPEQIRGRHVIGVLPLSLACEAASVTEIPLSLTPEDRGQELSLERLREIAGAPRTYRIEEV